MRRVGYLKNVKAGTESIANSTGFLMRRDCFQFSKQGGSIKTIVIVFLMIGFWLWFFNVAPLSLYATKLQEIALNLGVKFERPEFDPSLILTKKLPDKMEVECSGNSPKSGSMYLLTPQKNHLKMHARFFATNEHVFPVWIILAEQETDDDFAAIFLMPNQSAQLSVPVDQYALKVQSGRIWCNLTTGFSDAEHIQSAQAVPIKINEVTHLRLMPYGQQPAEVMISLSHSLGMLANGQQSIKGSGSLILQRVMGGHYAVEGTINQKTVYFLVDTGATSVAISENFAKYAGITECKKSKSRTANGLADICIATAKELTVGQFVLNNVEVNYGKGMTDDIFLLGMNVIGQFKMEQHGDVMKLSLP